MTRALRHRNFRLFFFGQSISQIGNWMTRLATTWLVYNLTHSAWLLGVVNFAGNILTFLLAPITGAWIERMNRRSVLIVTQAAAALQSLALAFLTLTHQINLTEIIALTMLQGVINAFDMPGRQSFLVHMVDDKSDLANAIAINSSMANGARLIGPAIAGVVIAAVGEGWCFFIDGISYIAVIASLVAMRISSVAQHRKNDDSLLDQIREGWQYVSTYAPVRMILLLFALVCLMGMPYSVLTPVFATKVFHGNATTLGWLTGAAGLGAFASALTLAARKSVVGLPRRLTVAGALFGISLVAFGASRDFGLSLLLMALVGFSMAQCLSITNTLLQTIVPEDKRARVMSYYTMAFFGMVPFGSLLAGALADRIGAAGTVTFTGACILFTVIVNQVVRRTRCRSLGYSVRASGVSPSQRSWTEPCEPAKAK